MTPIPFAVYVDLVAEAIHAESPRALDVHWEDLKTQEKELRRRQARATIKAMSDAA